MVSYENFYTGSVSSLSPKYGDFVGYRIPASEFAMTTDARTANQVKAASNSLNTGAKLVELSMMSPEVFEAIPEQHLTELNRLTKLVGAKPSVHGILTEPSGYTKEGWSEINREAAEKQIMLAVERAHKIDPEGNIPITFHGDSRRGGNRRSLGGGNDEYLGYY